MRRRKSPQDKKRLSYLKDRRNVYGENSKSSRRNIPRGKRRRHQSARRREANILATLPGAVDVERAEEADVRVVNRPGGRWKWTKWPDAPLYTVVESSLKRRLGFEGDRSRNAARLDRVRRRTRGSRIDR